MQSNVRFRRALLAPALALLLAMPLSGAASAPVANFNLDAIRTQQAEIRTGVQAGSGHFKDMPQATRQELLSKQAEVLATIDGKTSAEQLNADEQSRVFNALEWIEAAINKADDERMVCELRSTLGSNRRTRVCMTAGQMREARERSRQEIETNQNMGRRQ